VLMTWVLAVILGVLMATLLAVFIGYLSVQLEEIYFAMITLSFSMALYVVFFQDTIGQILAAFGIGDGVFSNGSDGITFIMGQGGVEFVGVGTVSQGLVQKRLVGKCISYLFLQLTEVQRGHAASSINC